MGNSTGEHDAIQVNINAEALGNGTHTAFVNITSNGGDMKIKVAVNVLSKGEERKDEDETPGFTIPVIIISLVFGVGISLLWRRLYESTTCIP